MYHSRRAMTRPFLQPWFHPFATAAEPRLQRHRASLVIIHLCNAALNIACAAFPIAAFAQVY
jgi:hypothetical protein